MGTVEDYHQPSTSIRRQKVLYVPVVERARVATDSYFSKDLNTEEPAFTQQLIRDFEKRHYKWGTKSTFLDLLPIYRKPSRPVSEATVRPEDDSTESFPEWLERYEVYR